MEVTGTLLNVLPSTSGISKNGNSWSRQEFIIQTQEQYPKKICMSTSNLDALAVYAPGDTLKVSINIESREYNERWYTQVNAWKILKGE